MTCRQCRRQLTSYLHKALSDRVSESVQRHLDHCPECAGEAAAVGAVWETLGTAKTIEPSPGFDGAVWARVRERERSWLAGPSTLLRPARLAPVAALAATVFVGGWLGFRHGRTEATSTGPIQMAAAIEQQVSDAFAADPPGSVGEAYVTLVSLSPANAGGETQR